jgi:hypothetical protein
MKNLPTAFLTIAISTLAIAASMAQAPSFDEFLAPVADEPNKGIVAPTEVANPEAVKVTQENLTEDGKETSVVKASSTQDAINKAIQLKKEITVIKVGSGQGVVTRGVANYENYANRNASLISRRLAYTKAFMVAKRNLAEYLHGLTPDSQQDFCDSMDSYDSAHEDGLANTASVMSDTNQQKVEGMIRGYVVYKVDDNTEKSEVAVHLVTTPKTRGETLRASPGTIFARDREAGMKQVFAELKSGVLPPVGSRVITVLSDEGGEEVFFVAFGAEVNKINKNPTVERKLRTQAAQIARQRAGAGLVALIIGEQAAWIGGFSDKTSEGQEQFNELLTGDPDSAQCKIVGLAETRSSFENRSKTTNQYSYAQKGKLPPGVEPISWESEDGDWSYAAYVYNPSMTARAEAVRKAMTTGPGILDRGNEINQADGEGQSGRGENSADRENFDQDKPINPGPSGRATDDDDL